MTNRKGTPALYPDEVTYVRAQLAKGRTMRTIAQMMGRAEADLTKAYRSAEANPPTSRAKEP